MKMSVLVLLAANVLQAATITSITRIVGSPPSNHELFEMAGSAGEETFELPWYSNGLWQWVGNSHGQFVMQLADTMNEEYDNHLVVGHYGAGLPTLNAIYDFSLSPEPSEAAYRFMNGPWLGDPINLSESGLITFRLPVIVPDTGEYAYLNASYQLENLNPIPEPSIWALLTAVSALYALQRAVRAPLSGREGYARRRASGA